MANDSSNAESAAEAPLPPLWKRVLLFPAVVVFTCEWHRVHMAVIGASMLAFGLAVFLDSKPLALVAAVAAAPSVICMLLLLPLGVLVMLGLEGLGRLIAKIRAGR